MTETVTDTRLTAAPSATAGMLIRAPAPAVFAAFIDPAITANFWFTHGSGPLRPGESVQWEWAMYGVSADVQVKEVVPHERIGVEWPGESGPETVAWEFTALGENETFTAMTIAGFRGSGDEIVKQAIASTEALAMVLAGLKAYLEHDIRLNLVADRFPAGIDA